MNKRFIVGGNVLNFPYGERNFTAIIDENYLYVDRTQHIRFIEDWGKETLFLRPRRFGKSLLLSTLMAYYDIAKADDFERLFGKLAIGKKPTPLHNRYLVMRWDFSTIPSHGDNAHIERALNDYINVRITNFERDYRDYLDMPVNVHPENALTTFEDLIGVIRASDHKLYLFIDEYDNFANEIMMGVQGNNMQRYTEFVKGEGLFKTFFKNLKSLASGDGLERVFVTGVTPVVLNDVSSGSNTFENLTWDMRLNALCGFTEEEVRDMVVQVVENCNLPTKKAEEVLSQMRSFYDGSLFVSDTYQTPFTEMEQLYNPTLVFYFLKRFQRHCTYPQEMLDDNMQPDSNKLTYISSYLQGKPLILDALDKGVTITVSTLQRKFGATDMLDVEQQREYLATMLTYLGMLTVGGWADAGEVILRIPNLVMRKLYAERLQAQMVNESGIKLTTGRVATRRFFVSGELDLLCDYVEENHLSVFDNRDYRAFDELTLKALFISMLHYNNLYIMDSEPEILRQYGDLIMLLRPRLREMGKFDFLFEFKYVKLREVVIDGKSLNGQEVRAKSRAELLQVASIKEMLDKAKNQLRGYQKSLLEKYGSELRLRTYAVVGVGLDRVVWEEV